MRVEYINPFVETSYRVLKEVLGGIDVKRGELSLKSVAMPVMGVAALVGLAGDVEGRVLFDMSFQTALNVASKMNGETITQFDDLAKATISELANLITAQAVTKLLLQYILLVLELSASAFSIINVCSLFSFYML